MSKEAFIQGYRDAQEETVWDPTPLEVERAHPEYTQGDVDAYINGVLDGIDGETFRMRRCYCVQPESNHIAIAYSSPRRYDLMLKYNTNSASTA